MSSGLQVKSPLFSSDFNETWIFSSFFSKQTKISNFMKISPGGAELFHEDRRMDGRTNMTKLIVAFRNYANAPKKRKKQVCVALTWRAKWGS